MNDYISNRRTQIEKRKEDEEYKINVLNFINEAYKELYKTEAKEDIFSSDNLN